MSTVLSVVPLSAIGAATTTQAAQVAVSRMDGTAQAGNLREWNDDYIVLETDVGELRLPAAELLSVRWQGTTPATSPSRSQSGVAELVDGSLIPLQNLVVSGTNVTITPAAATQNQPVTIPVSGLSAVRFQHLDANLSKQWDDIRKQKLASDLLVVLKRDGTSLDYVEGVIGEVTNEQVEFKLEGDANRVDRSKVAGIIYYRGERRPPAESKVVLEGLSGLQASITTVRVTTPALVEFTTVGGVVIAWPIDDLQVADFSNGKIQYLSDIEPISENWTPLVGLPPGLSLAADYGRPRRDRSAFGGKLAIIEQATSDISPASPGSRREFDKGLAIRSRTEIAFRLPAQFSRFQTVVGIDPAANPSGNVQLTILGDDVVLLETEIASGQPPQSIDLKVAGTKRLRFLVDFGQNQDSGDWLNMCDARLVK